MQRKDTSLTRKVLSNQVKDIIVDSILNGEFSPGHRVVESTLARRLGVSQAPVREAVRDLVLMGFLKTEPYKGATVRSFSHAELNEVYLVRASIESLAARLAAPRLTEEYAKYLKGILKKMVAASKKKDLRRTAQLDNDFHETIVKISGNKMLYQVWKTLQFGYWTIVTTHVSEYDLEYLAVRHGKLLDALLTRDSEKAKRAMRLHIEELGKPIDDIGEREV
jgi:DNA-binding GntR family transcriptional regulator